MRWKSLQKAVLIFCAIYQKIEEKPPSGSSPSNWLSKAKQTYFDQEGRQFIYKRAWNLLQNSEKLMNMGKKGKAKNGCQDNVVPNIILVSGSSSPAPATFSKNQTKSETVGCNPNWKQPPGAKAEKRKVEESNFRQKKTQAFELSNEESTLQIAEARHANDIQEKIACIDQNKSDQLFMLQRVDNCPDEEARELFLARWKEIMEHVRNPTQTQTSLSLSSTNQATTHQPGPSSEKNGPLNVNSNFLDKNEDQDKGLQRSYTQSDARTESKLPWLDPDLS
jgi:hypothetical protein